MAGNIKATRLGDILLEKGLLREDQLQLAIAEQKRRRTTVDPSDKRMMDATSLGEILIEMGYITRQQLKRGLNWQMYLRKMTLVMSLMAPLMSAAGGAVAQTTTTNNTTNTSSSITTSLMIQAEDFSAMGGIKVEPTKDEGGGSNIGAIDASDWLAYGNHVIQAPATSNYKVSYRVSSLYGGGSFYLYDLDTGRQFGQVDVPKTNNFQKWVTIEQIITLPAGTHKLGITALTKGFNLNWIQVDYQGVALPATVQAEDYAAMKGIKVEATTDVGGGSNIGAIDAGDWLSYENTVIDIPATGNYKITYRTSSLYGGGSFAFHEADGSKQYDVVEVPKTGNFQKWVDVERIITLEAGPHAFAMTALAKGYNINWFKIEEAPAGSLPGNTVSSSSSSQPSSVAVSSSSQPSSAPVVSSSSQPSSTPVVASSSQPSSVAVSSSSQPSSVAVSSSSQASNTPVSSSSSSQAAAGGTPTLSLRIEAEAYSAMAGIKVEATKDEGGGSNIGAIDASDWLAYGNHVIQAPATSNYKVSYRVSSLYGGGSFYLYDLDTGRQFGQVDVPKTNNFQKWVTIEQIITLPAGTHKLGITALTKGFNLNWIQVDYQGVALPVTVQAEDYTAMKGIKVEATTDVGGGSNIGAIDAGDWLSYENTVIDIPATGHYKITYRTSSLYGGGSFAFHEADGSKQYDVVEVPKTGNFQKWIDVERIITLEAGPHIFGMTALAKGYNINWFKIEEAPAGSLPGNSVSSSSSSSSAVSSAVSSQASSAPVVSSSSSSSAANSSASSVASSSGNEGFQVAGPVYLRWNIPNLREDGAALNITELGGYEVRYRRATEAEYTYVSVEDAYKNELNLSWLEGNYVFEVAAFDKNGLYSRFIKIKPN
jgi:hypothetical protein